MSRTKLHLLVGGAASALVGLAAVSLMVGPGAMSTVLPRTTHPSSAPKAPDHVASIIAGDVHSQLAGLERRRGGRIGLMAIDTGTGDQVAYRSDERFAVASTVKVLLAAVVLDQLSARELERRIFWTEDALVAHSPVTEQFVENGMTVRQLIDAALTLSDNTATNLLFGLAGGPEGVNAWLAEGGDSVTSIDRVEPDLNSWRPGEGRDTSTPRALARIVRSLTLGGALPRDDRWLLNDGLRRSLTGTELVRAAVPPSWEVGDKSGTASYGTRNNVAVIHPPGRAPWILVVMTSHRAADAEADDVLVARAAKIVVEHWS